MVSLSGIVTSGICAVIFLVIGIGGPFLFDSLIQDGANSQVKLLPKQADQWAQIPGAVGASVLRNFTFYNFTNEYEVIFENAQPAFEEIGPYSFSENHNFTQLTYPPGAESVDFYLYQYFLPIGDTTGEEKINMINIGAMGAWYQMKNAGDSQLAISIFGDLIPSVKEQVMSSTIGLVLGLITFDKKTTVGMISNVEGLTDSQKEQIAFDPNYGLGSFETNFPWVDMVYGFDEQGEIMEQPDGSGEFQFLKNYFGLTYKQMSQIQDIIYKGNRVDTEELLKDILLKKYNAIEVGIIMGVLKKQIQKYNLEIIDTGVFGVYNAIKTILCTSYPSYKCDQNLFGAVQWTSSGITNITGVIQGLVNQELENLHEDVRINIEIPSIAFVNSTVIGAPEIAYYYESAFNNKTSKFYANQQNIPNEFLPNNETVVQWSVNAQETLEGDDFIKTPQAICNIGNLNDYYDLGNKYDAATNATQKAMYLQQFQERTYLWSENAAYVYWNYLKYMLHEFAEMQYIGGNSGSAALGSVIGQAQGLNFIGMTDNLLPLITSSLIAEELKDQACLLILSQGFTQSQAQQLCYDVFGLKTAQTLNQTNVADLISICNVDNVQYITQIMEPLGLTFEQSLFNLNQLCNQDDIQQDSTLFKDILGTTRAELSQQYGCNQPQYCTNYEIAIRQWNSTEITQNPTQAMMNVGLNVANTAQDWIPELEGPFEWGYFCQKFSNLLTKDGEPIFYLTDIDQLTQLMSFDRMWAGTVISYATLQMTVEGSTDLKYVEENFFVPPKQQPQLLAFFRWAALQAFGGFTFENTVSGALFGYVDPFVQNLKTMNPQQGGDPSIDDVIATSDLNITSIEDAQDIEWLQSMYTGVGNMKDIRNYKSVSGSDEIRVVTKAFNGTDIYTTSYNPYAVPVKIFGNDGSQSNSDQQEGQTNTIFITELFMGQELKQNYSINHHGLDCYRYQPQPKILYNKTMNPDNAKYYFDGPSGLQNMTSVQQAPLFNSQTHFYMSQQDLIDNITVTKNGMIQKPSKYDETWVDTEKITGVTLSVLLNLQLNYEMSPDLIFPIEYNRYLPIYYMYRGTNFTSDQVEETFGALKDGLKAKLAVEIIGIILGILFIFLAAFLFYRFRKQRMDIDHQEIDDEDEELEQAKYQQITDKQYAKPKKEKINSTGESQFVTYLSDKK